MIRGSRLHWARRPSTILLLGVLWVTVCAYIILEKAHINTSQYIFYFGTSQLGSSSQSADRILQSSSTSGPASAAGCKAENLPTPDVVQARFTNAWGHMCVPLRHACYDEGTFVLYHPSSHPSKGGKAPQDPLPLGNNHLGFRDLGDTYGVIKYPEIIFRPNNNDEEAADLNNPSFSNCSQPVVLYLNHLYMFGDFMIRTMPTFVNAINSGAWDGSHTLVIATGGQKLQQWQKLMLQPLTHNPIVTLSAASSRAAPLLQQQQIRQQLQRQSQRRRLLYQTAAQDALTGTSRSSNNWHRQLRQRAGTAVAGSGSSSSGKGPQSQRPWEQWQQLSQQGLQRQQQQSAGPSLHTTQQQQQQQLPPQWRQWQQEWDAWKQTSVPVVVTSAAAAAADSQQQEQQQRLHSLQWELVHPPPPITAYGRCFESLTVCSLQEPRRFSRPVPHPVWSGAQHIRTYWTDRYGHHYKQLTQQLSQQLQQPKTLRVVFAVRSDKRFRRILDLQELLKWCNNWRPVDQHGILSSRYHKTVCVAHEFGKHGEVHSQPQQQQQQQQQKEEHERDVKGQPATAAATASASTERGLMVRLHDSLAEAVGTLVEIMSGRHQRRLLDIITSTSTSSETSRQLHRANPASSRSSSSSTAGQPPSPSSGDPAPHGVTGQELPLDPDLDPRALLADLAVLDESDVVIGVHGAQLYNALFMSQHKSLVEVRPYQFTGDWPDSYFQDPLVTDDASGGIFWWGVDTTSPQNSAPGHHEQAGTGCCYQRDRHTRIESKAMEYLLRRIIWCDGRTDKYKQLHGRKETHITDTLQRVAAMSQPSTRKDVQQQVQQEKGKQQAESQNSQQQQQVYGDYERYAYDNEEAYMKQHQQLQESYDDEQ